MKIRLLVLQRKQPYPGAYAPEVVSVVDEVTLDDNPTWWPREIENQKALIGEGAEAWAELTLWLDDADVEEALSPLHTPKSAITETRTL